MQIDLGMNVIPLEHRPRTDPRPLQNCRGAECTSRDNYQPVGPYCNKLTLCSLLA